MPMQTRGESLIVARAQRLFPFSGLADLQTLISEDKSRSRNREQGTGAILGSVLALEPGTPIDDWSLQFKLWPRASIFAQALWSGEKGNWSIFLPSF